jgi:hypothetical protein
MPSLQAKFGCLTKILHHPIFCKQRREALATGNYFPQLGKIQSQAFINLSLTEFNMMLIN